MEWNAMGKFIKSLREGVEPQAEATMMKDTGEIVHNCAKHVEHAEWGTGATLAEEHAEPDDAGNIAWYDIMFEHGLERAVPTESLNILVSEAHVHAKKKMKEGMETKPAVAKKNDGNLANNAKPYDKVTQGDVITGRLGKDEQGGKLRKEEAEELDELSKGTLGSYVKKAANNMGQVGHALANKQASAAEVDRMTNRNDIDNKFDAQDKMKAALGADSKSIQKDYDKIGKRQSGISKAVNKLTKEEVEEFDLEQVDETIEYRTVTVVVNEAGKNYDAYFKAAMKSHGVKHPGELKSDDDKKKFFNKVDAGFKAKNEDVFVEAWMRSDAEERMAAHRKAGNKVSDEKHTTKNGEGHHSFVVTEPSGKRTRHIFHGNSRKLETMSAAPKSKLAHETGEDEDDK